MANCDRAVDEAAQLRELAVQVQAVHTTADGKAIDDIIANADSVEVLVDGLLTLADDIDTSQEADDATADSGDTTVADTSSADAPDLELSAERDDAVENTTVDGIDLSRLDIAGDVDAIRADLETLLTDEYLSIIQQLVASPSACLSLPELRARNPGLTAETLRRRLDALADRERPLVCKLDPDSAPPEGYPQVYYAATERAVALLKQIGLYEGCSRLLKLCEHANMELPNADDGDVTLADIEAFEDRPVPEWAMDT